LREGVIIECVLLPCSLTTALFGGFGGAGGDDEASAKMVEGLLMTKKACMDFAEELQLEISEVRMAPVPVLVDTHANIVTAWLVRVHAPTPTRRHTRLRAAGGAWADTYLPTYLHPRPIPLNPNP
jgi:hypothetical protein